MLPTAVLLIIAVILVVLIGTYFIRPIFGIDPEAMEEGAQAQLGSKGTVTYQTPVFEDPTQPEYMLHLLPLNPWEPFQPSEIACYIADIIYNDYQIYGKDIERGDCRTIVNSDNRVYECLIGDAMIFTLQKFDQSEMNSYGTEWENILNNVDEGPCHLCEEGGNAVPLLDETCVNMQFRDRKVETSDFCNDNFVPSLAETTGDIRFGNNGADDGGFGCYIPPQNVIGSLSNWRTHCSEHDAGVGWPNAFCDNGDNLIYDWNNWWVADCAGGDVCDNDETLDPPEIVNEIHNDVTNGILDHDGRRYVMGITWLPEEQKYNVHFARVPQLQLVDSSSLLNRIVDVVRNDGATRDWKFRYNYLGKFTKDARSIVDMLVWGDDNIGITDIMQEIGDNTNLLSREEDGWSEDCGSRLNTILSQASVGCVVYNDCNSIQNCLGTGIFGLSFGDNYHVAAYPQSLLSGSIMGDCDVPGCEDTPKSIIVKSNINDGQNGVLETDRLYRVVVNNWVDLVYNPSGTVIGTCYGGCWDADAYARNVAVLDVTDNWNSCCDAETMKFAISKSGSQITPRVADLFYCYDKEVYFYEQTCLNKNLNDMTEKSSCTIDDQESEEDTLYCWAGEPSYGSRPEGCTGSSFSSSASNFYACIDTDGDDIFDKELTASSSVSCPDKCEPGEGVNGVEYSFGSGSPCTYLERECEYGCSGDRCVRGLLCPTKGGTSQGCGDDCCSVLTCNMIGTECWTEEKCIREGNPAPTCTWTNKYDVDAFTDCPGGYTKDWCSFACLRFCCTNTNMICTPDCYETYGCTYR